jgi:ribulose kinase
VIGANETTALHAVAAERKARKGKTRKKEKRRANAEKVERVLRYSGAFGPSLVRALCFYDDFYGAHSAYANSHVLTACPRKAVRKFADERAK